MLWHTNCGAVAATMNRDAAPGQISWPFQYIRPAVKNAERDLDQAVCENVRLQAQTLAEGSTVIAQRTRDGKLIIAGSVYDLAIGFVIPVALDDI